MTVAAHRIVGVVEWPERVDGLFELPAILADEIHHADNSLPSRILLWRLPVEDQPIPAAISADIVQLRSDLQELFEEITRPSAG